MSSRYVVVIRHGERLDYVMHDEGKNWLIGQPRPWDPPLSVRGVQQGRLSGQRLKTRLEQMGLPPIAAVYSSPFLRCRQTACAILQGLTEPIEGSEDAQGCVNNYGREANLKVRVEMGLSESLNESWYQSWALPGSSGVWGYSPPNEQGAYNSVIDEATVHPAAKVPAQKILSDWQTYSTPSNDVVDTTTITDLDYVSQTAITLPYSLFPRQLESQRNQRKRMKQVLDTCAVAGQTIVLVTHGGPSILMYNELTGNQWYVHGDIKFCGFSIYGSELSVAGQHDDTSSPTTEREWRILVTNESVVDSEVKGFTLE